MRIRPRQRRATHRRVVSVLRMPRTSVIACFLTGERGLHALPNVPAARRSEAAPWNSPSTVAVRRAVLLHKRKCATRMNARSTVWLVRTSAGRNAPPAAEVAWQRAGDQSFDTRKAMESPALYSKRKRSVTRSVAQKTASCLPGASGRCAMLLTVAQAARSARALLSGSLLRTANPASHL